MTIGEIDRLGNRIRESADNLASDTLHELEEYRVSHKEPLSKVFKQLCSLTRSVSADSIVTYRIKRIESIVNKLNRYGNMRFSRMGDVGGCRCILRNDSEVYRVYEKIAAEISVKKITDYIKEPQSSGYRSLHLYIEVAGSGKTIEVQLRNKEDHNWATHVEITDLLYGVKLKEYGDNKELLRFHFLLSQKSTLNIDSIKEILYVVKKYSYFERMSAQFSKNYLEVRMQWLEVENKPNHKYFLLVSSPTSTPIIRSFDSFESAEFEYINYYKSNSEAIAVLTHSPFPNYRHISMAYSNYILTMHAFEKLIFDIIEQAIVQSLRGYRYIDFIKYLLTYNSYSLVYIKNLYDEIISIHEYTNSNKPGFKNSRKKKEKEWAKDIVKQISERHYQFKGLGKQIGRNWPKSIFRNVLSKVILRPISWYYKREIGVLTKKAEMSITKH